jgi:nicotinamide-nucleotide amidase
MTADLIQSIAHQLQSTHSFIVTAESCTGGLIAATLTSLPGSSLWFERGFVTYSNLAKEEMLAVPSRLLEEFGAVSSQVAQAMAQGALAKSSAQVAIAVTGIAGPSGGSKEKPVGTVWFGLATAETTKVIKAQYSGDREAIRLAACQQALQEILVFLSEIS